MATSNQTTTDFVSTDAGVRCPACGFYHADSAFDICRDCGSQL